MLVLSRNENQSIEVGEGVRITILAVVKGRVKIGIDAPRTTKVLRTELIPCEEDGEEFKAA